MPTPVEKKHRCGHAAQSWPPPPDLPEGAYWNSAPMPCATCARLPRLAVPVDDPKGGVGLITFERVMVDTRWIWRRAP